MIVCLFKGTGRELMKIIKPLLYKGIITQVIKENYIAKIYIKNKKIYKENIKKVYFFGDNEEKIKQFILNNNKFEIFNNKIN